MFGLVIQDRRSVMRLFHSRDFSRLYSNMGFTRVSLSETQHLFWNGFGFFFMLLKK